MADKEVEMDFLLATGRFRRCDLSEVLVARGDGTYEFPWGCCFQFLDPVPEGDSSYGSGCPAIVHGKYLERKTRIVGEVGGAFASDDGLYAVLFPVGVATRSGDDPREQWRSTRPQCLAVCRDVLDGERIVRRPPRPFYVTPRR